MSYYDRKFQIPTQRLNVGGWQEDTSSSDPRLQAAIEADAKAKRDAAMWGTVAKTGLGILGGVAGGVAGALGGGAAGLGVGAVPGAIAGATGGFGLGTGLGGLAENAIQQGMTGGADNELLKAQMANQAEQQRIQERRLRQQSLLELLSSMRR